MSTIPSVGHRNWNPIVIGLFALAILMAAWIGLIVAYYPSPPPAKPGRAELVEPRPGSPRATPPMPVIAPVTLQMIAPDRARAINAAIPFLRGPHPAARPFVFAGAPEDRERALTCLASAVWFEAGDDKVGQEAVAQVILNRARHPAYPKTICGVVFQGSQLPTGCQFTFSCDGSMARRMPTGAAWERARAVADAALSGHVVAQVGTATSYHTDWVVPYWSNSLVKIAEVHTHLFFRWPGWWGQPGAFSGVVAGTEPLDPRLAGLSRAPVPAAMAVADASPGEDQPGTPPPNGPVMPAGVSAADLAGSRLLRSSPDGMQFALVLDRSVFPGKYATAALALCGSRPNCTVYGWLDPGGVPAALPAPAAALHGASFVYRAAALSGARALWNCRLIRRSDASQCLPGTEGPVTTVAQAATATNAE